VKLVEVLDEQLEAALSAKPGGSKDLEVGVALLLRD